MMGHPTSSGVPFAFMRPAVTARRFLTWAPLLLYSAFIFYQSSGPAPPIIPGKVPGLDKVLHAGGYALWGALAAWAIARTWPSLPLGRLVWIAGVAGALFGLSDEIHQSFVPSRSADAFDLLADVLGSFAGAKALALLAARWPRKEGGAPP